MRSGKSGCIPAKVVLFLQKGLCSGNYGCIPAKAVLLGKKRFYSVKMVVIGQELV